MDSSQSYKAHTFLQNKNSVRYKHLIHNHTSHTVKQLYQIALIINISHITILLTIKVRVYFLLLVK